MGPSTLLITAHVSASARSFISPTRANIPIWRPTHRFRNGRPALDLLYGDDAADALAAVAAWPKSDVFHFGTGVLHSTAELATIIGSLSGQAVRQREIAIDEFTSNIAFPSDKARTLLNWSAKVR